MTWPAVPFGEVFEIQLGKMLDSKKNAGELRPYLANRNVRWGECDVSNLAEMRFTKSDREKFDLKKGDLLVCEGGEVGRTAIWNDEIEGCYYQKAIHRLRPKGDVDPRFVLHYMRLAAERNLFARLTNSTSIAHLTKAKLQKVPIPLPSLAEQKRIARILDAADALRAKRRESLAQLDTLLQSTFLDMFGDPITNPMGWEMAIIGDLLESASYGTSKKADVADGKYPILRMGNITYLGGWDFESLKYIDLNEKELLKHLVHRGQILFNRTNSRELVGKTAVYREDEPMAFAGYLIRGIVNETADPEYIGAFMNTLQIKKFLQNKCKNIVGMANINAKEFQSIPIAAPPIDLQHRFTAIVESVEQQKADQRAHVAELDSLFASLQSRAFRGDP